MSIWLPESWHEAQYLYHWQDNMVQAPEVDSSLASLDELAVYAALNIPDLNPTPNHDEFLTTADPPQPPAPTLEPQSSEPPQLNLPAQTTDPTPLPSPSKEEAVLISDTDDDIQEISAPTGANMPNPPSKRTAKTSGKKPQARKKDGKFTSAKETEEIIDNDGLDPSSILFGAAAERPRRAAAERGEKRISEASQRMSFEESEEEVVEGSDSDEGWVESGKEGAAPQEEEHTGDTTRSCSPETIAAEQQAAAVLHHQQQQNYYQNFQQTNLTAAGSHFPFMPPFNPHQFQSYYALENSYSGYPYYTPMPMQEAPRQAPPNNKRKQPSSGGNGRASPPPAKKPKNRPPSLPASLLSAGATGHYPHFIPTPKSLSTTPSQPPLTAQDILASARTPLEIATQESRKKSASAESKFKRREIAEMLAFLTQTICWKDVAAAVGNKRRTANSYASHWRNVLVKNVVERYSE